ncbi:MAG: hypothetical protein K0S70_531 [Microbacterium sp.]|nr:hypothetical protein [Microbacterium sp.]
MHHGVMGGAMVPCLLPAPSRGLHLVALLVLLGLSGWHARSARRHPTRLGLLFDTCVMVVLTLASLTAHDAGAVPGHGAGSHGPGPDVMTAVAVVGWVALRLACWRSTAKIEGARRSVAAATVMVVLMIVVATAPARG